MTTNHPLGHLKITDGDTAAAIKQIDEWISNRAKAYSIPLNLTKYIVSRDDKKLTESIMNADLVIADGVPIKWLAKRAKISDVHRVTGVDLSEELLKQAADKKWRLFFLGASPENLERAVERVKQRFDDPIIAGVRDGYFSEEDVSGIIAQINEAKPDILFLGLGMPQKEYFLHDHHADMDVPFCITVGGAIDIWADVKKRTPKLIQAVGLEWLVRSMYDLSKARSILRYGGSFLWELLFYRRA